MSIYVYRKCWQGVGRDKGRSPDPHIVDLNIDLMVKKLRHYQVSVAGIQETKWFGMDVWPADGYTFLHSG